MKNKWCRKRGTRKWDEEIANFIQEKQNAFNRYVATKSLENRIEYYKRRAIARREIKRKHRESWNKFVSDLERDVTRSHPRVYKILWNFGQVSREQLQINVVDKQKWGSIFPKFMDTPEKYAK